MKWRRTVAGHGRSIKHGSSTLKLKWRWRGWRERVGQGSRSRLKTSARPARRVARLNARHHQADTPHALNSPAQSRRESGSRPQHSRSPPPAAASHRGPRSSSGRARRAKGAGNDWWWRQLASSNRADQGTVRCLSTPSPQRTAQESSTTSPPLEVQRRRTGCAMSDRPRGPPPRLAQRTTKRAPLRGWVESSLTRHAEARRTSRDIVRLGGQELPEV